MSLSARRVERFLFGGRKRAIPGIADERYSDTGDASLVAIGTAALDGIRPGEGAVGSIDGVVTDGAREIDDLSINRPGHEGSVAATYAASQADGGQVIETIRTAKVHRATY